jgi:hypothetical protein
MDVEHGGIRIVSEKLKYFEVLFAFFCQKKSILVNKTNNNNNNNNFG